MNDPPSLFYRKKRANHRFPTRKIAVHGVYTICYLLLFNKTISGVHSVLRQTHVHPPGNFPGSGTGPGELRGFFQGKCVSIVFHFQVDV